MANTSLQKHINDSELNTILDTIIDKFNNSYLYDSNNLDIDLNISNDLDEYDNLITSNYYTNENDYDFINSISHLGKIFDNKPLTTDEIIDYFINFTKDYM